MNLDKKQLKEFLSFIKKIINFRGNEWMKDDLLDMLDLTEAHTEERIEGKKIDDIHKYMKLDVDQTVIDYSLFPDDMRITLERDCLEMQKWRHGKMDMGKVNGFDIQFSEYCRYAHMQAEGLVNFYFKENYTNELHLKDILKVINATIKEEKHKRYDETVDAIPYGYKLNYLPSIPQFPITLKWQLESMKNLRNYLSHRGISDKNTKKYEYAERFLNQASYSDVFNSLNTLNNFVINNLSKNSN